jgi:uncharacterized membrane protein
MPLTFFIAQLFGLTFIIASASMALQKERIINIVEDLFRDKALLFIVGIINLMAGFLVVLSHNVWTGGILPAAVTLLGWLLALRGIVLMWISPQVLKKLYRSFGLERRYYTFTAIVFIIGLYFTFAGFGWLK